MIIANVILFLSIINFLLMSFVFFNTKKEKGNAFFLIFSLITTIWLFNNFLLTTSVQNVYALSYGLGILVATSALVWVYDLVGKKLSPLILFFIVPFSIVAFFVSSFTNFVVGPITKAWDFGYENKIGFLFLSYSFYLGTLVTIALYNLFSKFLKEKEGFKKNQIASILIGGIIFGSFSFAVNFLIPLLFDTFKFSKIVNLAFFPLLIFIVYSIFKHQLFGIKIMLNRVLMAIFLALVILDFSFSISRGDYFWHGFLLFSSLIFSYLIFKNVDREIEFNKKLLEEAEKNLDFEQRLKDIYAKMAKKETKMKYSSNKF